METIRTEWKWAGDCEQVESMLQAIQKPECNGCHEQQAGGGNYGPSTEPANPEKAQS